MRAGPAPAPQAGDRSRQSRARCRGSRRATASCRCRGGSTRVLAHRGSLRIRLCLQGGDPGRRRLLQRWLGYPSLQARIGAPSSVGGIPTRHLRRIRPDLSRDITVFFCGVAYPNRISLLRQADELLSRHPWKFLDPTGRPMCGARATDASPRTRWRTMPPPLG